MKTQEVITTVLGLQVQSLLGVSYFAEIILLETILVVLPQWSILGKTRLWHDDYPYIR